MCYVDPSFLWFFGPVRIYMKSYSVDVTIHHWMFLMWFPCKFNANFARWKVHITAIFLIKIAAIAIYITRAHYIVYSEAIYYVVLCAAWTKTTAMMTTSGMDQASWHFKRETEHVVGRVFPWGGALHVFMFEAWNLFQLSYEAVALLSHCLHHLLK